MKRNEELSRSYVNALLSVHCPNLRATAVAEIELLFTSVDCLSARYFKNRCS